jgi:hypothetical protein
MIVANLLVGVVLLVAGRRLFWLFVAAVGFVAGLQLATPITADEPSAAALLIALVAGAAGAALAVFLQPIAVAIAGFLAGAFVVGGLTGGTTWHAGGALSLAVVAGGLIGAAVMLAVFDWALIVLSSLFGAQLVVSGLPIAPDHAGLAFAVLVGVGLIAQTLLSEEAPAI